MPSAVPSRASNGRFLAIRPLTEEAQIRATQRRDTLDRNADTADSLFDGFLSVFMRVADTESEAIAAGSGAGPLSFIAESLIRRKYLLGRYERCTRARHYYFQQRCEVVKRQSQLPTVTVRVSRGGKDQKVQKPIFKKCRLPKLTARSQELKDVLKWIDSGIEKDLLKTAERSAALEIVQNAKSIYANVRAEIGYRMSRVGAVESSPMLGAGTGSGVEASERTTEVRNQEGTSSRTPQDMQDELDHGNDENCNEERAAELVDPRVDEESVLRPPPNSEDERLSQQFERMIKWAKDDELFFLMCKAVDLDDDSALQICSVASVFLKELKEEGKHVWGMLEDALRYSIGVRFGRGTQSVDQDLEDSVRTNVELLKSTRGMLGKRAYEDMSWESVRKRPGSDRAGSSTCVTDDTCLTTRVESTESENTRMAAEASERNDIAPVRNNSRMEETFFEASSSVQRPAASRNSSPPATVLPNQQTGRASENNNPHTHVVQAEGSNTGLPTTGNERTSAVLDSSLRGVSHRFSVRHYNSAGWNVDTAPSGVPGEEAQVSNFNAEYPGTLSRPEITRGASFMSLENRIASSDRPVVLDRVSDGNTSMVQRAHMRDYDRGWNADEHRITGAAMLNGVIRNGSTPMPNQTNGYRQNNGFVASQRFMAGNDNGNAWNEWALPSRGEQAQPAAAATAAFCTTSHGNTYLPPLLASEPLEIRLSANHSPDQM